MPKKSLLIALLTTAAFIAVAYFAVAAVASWLHGLDSGVTAAVITAIVGLFGLWYAQWHAKSREISESHRQSKIEVYSIFFDIVDKFQDGSFKAEMGDPEDVPESLKKEFRRFNRGLIVWGSPAVIQSWHKFRRVAGNGDKTVLIAVDEMYQAMRKDLGNSNFGLRTGDLIKATISDPENWD